MPREDELSPLSRSIPWLHGALFGIGGLWAVLHRRSFEAVSGPKFDYWLARTVGGLLTVVGVLLVQASRRNRITPELTMLAVGTSAVLTSIDVVYTAKRRIRPVYLLDAVANIGLIVGWTKREAEMRRLGDFDSAG